MRAVGCAKLCCLRRSSRAPLHDSQSFLTRALMPLHKPKCVSMYHQQLAYCVTQVQLRKSLFSPSPRTPIQPLRPRFCARSHRDSGRDGVRLSILFIDSLLT
jgi:hypothetical protein